MQRRCVCGRSSRLPLCDGSHGDGWACSAADHVPVCVVGGAHLHSLVERLSHEVGGVAAHRRPGRIEAQRLWVLTDGTDLQHILPELNRLTGHERRVVVVDSPISSVGSRFDGWTITRAAPENPMHLWRAVQQALERPAAAVRRVRRAFLSHAVADEHALTQPLAYLRDYVGAELFVCGDSIRVGTRWHDQIETQLRQAECMVWLCSAHSVGSTYCAYEAGVASALGLPIHVISLDGTLPPAFLAHLHAMDLPRRQASRPWITASEALCESLLEALEEPLP